MSKLSSFMKPNFRTVHEAEQAALRAFSIGFVLAGIGVLLVLIMSWNTPGLAVMTLGGLVVLGDIAWFVLISKYHSDTKDCPRCHKANPVFREEKHFKCVSCGHVALLRDR